jgi:hypothetical protein
MHIGGMNMKEEKVKAVEEMCNEELIETFIDRVLYFYKNNDFSKDLDYLSRLDSAKAEVTKRMGGK